MSGNLLSCVRESDCHFLTTGFRLKLLQTLDLSDNRLSEADNAVQFNDVIFPQLVHLNLRRNQLRVIPVGMFAALSKLSTLDLSENPIEELEAQAFADLLSLKRLNIENCPHLGHIKLGSFVGLGALKVLNIQNSGLVHIHHTALIHMNHLEELYLRNNRLGESVDMIEKLTIKKSSLKVFDLGDNQLSEIPSGILLNSHNLAWISLDRNRLFDCDQLKPLFESNVENLNLAYNRYVQPRIDCFDRIKSLVNLNLAGNPFMCSCETTKPLADWMVSRNIAVEQTDEYLCVAPKKYSGKNILQMTYSNMDCYGMTFVKLLVFIGLLLFFFLFVFQMYGRFKLAYARCGVRSGASLNPEASTGNGCVSFSGSSVAEMGTRYSPLDEEEVQDITGKKEFRKPVVKNHSSGNTDPDAETHEFHNGNAFAAYNIDRNTDIGDNSMKNKFRRTIITNTFNPTRALPHDSPSKQAIIDDVDNEVMLPMPELGGYKTDCHLEDAV